MACQDQVITTNSMKVNVFHQPGSAKCRLCGSHNATVDHLLTSCHVLAQSCYKKHHDAVAQIVHWELAKRGGFDIVENWWDHHLMSVMQNSSMKLLWDYTIQTDRHLSHNRPDMVCVYFIMNHCFLIDVAIPGDSRLSNKVTEKLERYTDLKLEIQKM